MSASGHCFGPRRRSSAVLGELLHSMSQPLTGLRCSLELTLQLPLELPVKEVVEQQQESVAAALQQTERVIGMVRLMREYLDAEQPGQANFSSALAPVLRGVVEELASIAAVRGVELRLVGTCAENLQLPESRLRLALQYLIATVVDEQPGGGRVMLLLGEGPAGTVLRAEGGPDRRGSERSAAPACDSASTLRRVRIAIARRVLENAGASLVFNRRFDGVSSDVGQAGVGAAGFVLRIPRRAVEPGR